MKRNLFENCMTAMITPFKNDEVDYKSLEKLIENNVQNGVGIVVCGTTAETATLSSQEYEDIIKFVVEKVADRVGVMAGCGSNSTKKSIENAKFCESAGVDSLLIVTPYYNKTTQEGIYQHYKTIAESVSLPIMLYNVPARTGLDMSSETTIRLSRIPNIVGIKEASGDITKAQEIIYGTDEDFCVYSGNDDNIVPMMSIGAKGVISVISNAYPKYIKSMVDAFENKEVVKAGKMQVDMIKLFKLMFIETNPIPVKRACHKLGLCENELRLPLLSMSGENAQKLLQTMDEFENIMF